MCPPLPCRTSRPRLSIWEIQDGRRCAGNECRRAVCYEEDTYLKPVLAQYMNITKLIRPKLQNGKNNIFSCIQQITAVQINKRGETTVMCSRM